MTDGEGQMKDPDWWRRAVVYQIYPRSFANANADGIGDLAGITSRIPYLAGLGVDALWLSPFYPSALADGGYDIDDYRNVHPAVGTLRDFDELAATAHAAGLRIIVDIVPNHSSDRHPWFVEALASPPGSPARARYHFLDGEGPDGSQPPSDWEAFFGGSAWTRVADGQWYLHLYTPQQPDLNWDNPEVRQDFLTTLEFWADRGVDGFRIDVAHRLAKDLTRPLPSHVEMTGDPPLDGSHRFYDRDEVHEISEEFRAVITGHLREARVTASAQTWVFSNHDVVRHATRYGLPNGTDLAAWLMTDGTQPPEDIPIGLSRARAATLLALALPGSTYLYQGEELGLREVATIPRDRLQDPMWERTGRRVKGRDGCRVPLPWTTGGPSFGFGDHDAHLPQPDWFKDYAVETQDEDRGSTLNLYRRALRLRRTLLRDNPGATFEWTAGPPEVLQFCVGTWTNVTNFGATAATLPAGTIVLSSGALASDRRLPPDTTAWITDSS
jgi:alpha-glucosidase